jgi:hypothetical protein
MFFRYREIPVLDKQIGANQEVVPLLDLKSVRLEDGEVWDSRTKVDIRHRFDQRRDCAPEPTNNFCFISVINIRVVIFR